MLLNTLKGVIYHH